MKVVKSVFVLLATRGHDILYSDWGEKVLHNLYVLFLYHKLSLFLIIVNTFS